MKTNTDHFSKPKHWMIPPSAILTLCAPTDMHNINRGPLSGEKRLTCTPDFLSIATNYNDPPSEFAPRQYGHPRQELLQTVIRKCCVEFVCVGLVKVEGELRLPEEGSVPKEIIDAISKSRLRTSGSDIDLLLGPFHICEETHYPPTCLVMGTEDKVFQISHLENFGKKLKKFGVPCKMVVAPGEGHAFDIQAPIDGEIHEKFLKPAIHWAFSFTV